MNPLTLVVTCVAGWMNRHQQVVIEYLAKEVRVLQEQLGRRPRFSDNQRCCLALKAKIVGRQGLRRFARVVTQDSLLARNTTDPSCVSALLGTFRVPVRRDLPFLNV